MYHSTLGLIKFVLEILTFCAWRLLNTHLFNAFYWYEMWSETLRNCSCWTWTEHCTVLCIQQVQAMTSVSQYSKFVRMISDVFAFLNFWAEGALCRSLPGSLSTYLRWSKIYVEDLHRWWELCLLLQPRDQTAVFAGELTVSKTEEGMSSQECNQEHAGCFSTFAGLCIMICPPGSDC